MTVDSPATTEFVAAGSTAELLDQLLAAASMLSEAIVANDGQHELIERIDVLWEAARPGVEEAQPDACWSSNGPSSCCTPGSTAAAPPTPTRPTTTSSQLVAAVAGGRFRGVGRTNVLTVAVDHR